MADAPQNVVIQASRVDASIIPPGFPLPYRLYVMQQGSDLQKVADASNEANGLAFQATLKNEEQDAIISEQGSEIGALTSRVNDQDNRITANTDAIASVGVRVSNSESAISAIQADYLSKTLTTPQSLSGALSVTTSLSVNGVQVISSRQTGWTASTGTALKGAFNSSQTYTISATYSQTEATAVRDGLIQARQRIKALEDALRSHGLIN